MSARRRDGLLDGRGAMERRIGPRAVQGYVEWIGRHI